MTTIVDTSVLVRYLTGDPPETAARARRFVDDAEEPLVLPLVVLAECAFVLTRVYGVPRAKTVDVLVDLVCKRNVGGGAREEIVHGLLLCRESARVSFADALVWAEARARGDARIATFDRRFPSEGLEVFEP